MRLTGLTTILATAISAAASAPESQQRALLQQYCAGCHNERKMTAGINLNSDLRRVPENARMWEKVVRKLGAGINMNSDLRRVPENAGMWERVVRKLHAGAMPPLGMPRPERSALD